jgi:hypothetical protein
MANDSDSPSQSPLRRGLRNFSFPYQPGNGWFDNESDLREENTQIWKSQVLVPSFTSLCANLGPLEKDKIEETNAFFPHDKTDLPLIFARNLDKPYNLHYLETRVFKAAPRIDKVEDYAWLDRIEIHKGSFWKDLVFLILFSCRGKALGIINTCS